MAKSLDELKDRLEQVDTAIAKATQWGAYLSVLFEEQQSLLRTISFLEQELEDE